MQLRRRTTLLIFACLLLMALTTPVALAQDPEQGKEAWENSGCMRCHGEMGEGVFGAPLAGRGEDNVDDGLTLEEWITQVRSPRNRMPAFSEAQVSDETIGNMYAYLASLPVPAEFGFKRIELPEGADPGQQLIIDKRCVACHGETGPGGFQERGEVPTFDGVQTQIRTPRRFMPSFSEDQISDAEIQQIVDYMASLVTPASLPQSGSVQQLYALVTWLSVLIGASFLIAGILLWRRLAHN